VVDRPAPESDGGPLRVLPRYLLRISIGHELNLASIEVVSNRSRRGAGRGMRLLVKIHTLSRGHWG
jgi:hypothetical protein